MTTGKRIQQARKNAKLSQKELGEKLGVSASMIGQYENDLRNPKTETLVKIANALNVNVSELYGGVYIRLEDFVSPSVLERSKNEILQSMKLDNYVRAFGYEFISSYPDVASKTLLCVDHNEKKLYLLHHDDISMSENFIHDYVKFQMTELLKKGKEIPDTEGWFKK